MELKAGYKQTEVGIIPEDWEIHAIGESMQLINGRAFKPSDWKDNGLPIIRIQNLNDAEATFNYCSGYVEDRHIIQSGDLLFAWSGTTGTSFGARVWNGETGVLNQHIFKVIPNQKKLTPEYTFLVLCKVQEQIEKQAHGFKTSFVHVKKSDLIRVQLPFPPTKTEQTAIATALSDTDALINALDKLIAKKRQIKQGAMQELLSGKKRLAGFSGEWEVKKLGDVANLINGRAYKLTEWETQGTPVIRLQNLTGSDNYYFSQLNLPAHQYCNFGDLLYMWSATFGTHIWKGGKAIYHYHIWKVEPIKGFSDKNFLFHKFNEITESLKQKSTNGGTMLHITKSFMENNEILFPPIEEQTAIAQILSDMDNEIAALENKLAKIKNIKLGMMQELLTGKTRLI